jgi:hypothetical protein
VTRLRVPEGLAVAAGDYRVERRDGGWTASSETGERLDLGGVWDDLRGAAAVEIECSRHPDKWWPAAGYKLQLAEVMAWRCPNCVWAFRQGLKGRGGTPQF